MILKLEELEKRCKKLELTVRQSGKRPAKKDYVEALREHFLKRDYPDGMPYQEVEPMLCFQEWNLTPAEQKEVWTSPYWVAQKKINGCRVILHFVKGVGVFAHSRTVSVQTFRRTELTKKLLFAGSTPSFDAVLDCEAIIERPLDTRPYTAKGEVTKTSLHSTTAVLHLDDVSALKIQRDQAPLQFYAFDIMSFRGSDLKHCPLTVRRVQLGAAIAQLHQENYTDVRGLPYEDGDRREAMKRVITAGGEGLILKNLQSQYIDSTSRSRNAWIKVKKRIEFDAYVSGFKRGEPETGWQNMVGALEFSVRTEKGQSHVIGYGQNVTMEERQRITIYDPETNSVLMIPEMYGRVAEISGQDISARVYRLSHCTIDRWREGVDGKTPEECTVNMVDLRRKADWVG